MFDIVVLSGGFDPIHIGHEKIAKYFLNKYFDEVWFVVTPMNPDKIEKGTSDENIRLEMIQGFCELNTKYKCCDIEFGLPKPNYTADTLDEIKKEFSKITIKTGLNLSLKLSKDKAHIIFKFESDKEILENLKKFND